MTTGDPLFGTPTGPWMLTFAWRPRHTFDGGWVWLRFCWKRYVHKHQWLDGGPDWWWQYRRFQLVRKDSSC